MSLIETLLALAFGAGTNELGLHRDRKSTRLNSSHLGISYAVFCLKKKKIDEPPRMSLNGSTITYITHPCCTRIEIVHRQLPDQQAQTDNMNSRIRLTTILLVRQGA